jgi:hypothetical protein
MAEWNARAYNRLNTPMQTWGEAIVAALPLRGDETSLDLGRVSYEQRIADPRLQMQFVEAMTEQSAADDPPFRQDYWRVNLWARRPKV